MTRPPVILVATWSEGLFAVDGEDLRQEVVGRPVRGLAADGAGAALAIVDGHTLQRRDADGGWTEVAASDLELSCCVRLGATVFVGTEDAQVLRLEPGGALERLESFQATPGRESWYAGQAIVDGRPMGPPLGVRSMTATCDGAAVLANVHVGGAPRSTDRGQSWRPTIAVEADVHQVRAHPTRPEIVAAASAAGLAVSRDGGASWRIEQAGLHALHCTAVALTNDTLYVSAAADHFAAEGAVYRRQIDGQAPLAPVGGGLPRWTGGIVDTDGIAARGAVVAVIDQSGGLQVSSDDGRSWTFQASALPHASGLLIC